ncbi:MAG: ABC transporter ATP-binding protein [Candidatus Eisenbacteria bacterium]
MLRVKGAAKEFPHRHGRVSVLREVDLEVGPGEYVSITGRSGSGKSTLLLMLGGMLSPSSGGVFIDDVPIYELGPAQRADVRRATIGFVFQSFNLVPYLTALENVQVPLLLSRVERRHQKEIAASLLARVGLDDRMDHKPSELSVGQQQRVAVARMLANDPRIILADEPTGNLDPETGATLLDFMDELNSQGKTIVVVTHDSEAARRAQRGLKLSEGSVVPA